MLKILFLGDIVGEVGREYVSNFLVKNRQNYDIVIANGENSAGGKGISKNVFYELINFGIDVVTLGNHTFARKEVVEIIDEPRIVRPLNYPEGNVGHGYYIINLTDRTKVAVINLLGRVFTVECLDCPFKAIENFLPKIYNETKIIIVDFHAEATSEKNAMKYFLDGRVGALLGTHTHVATSDVQITSNGMGYVTDVGMCGPKNSVIGLIPEIIIKRFLLCTPQKFVVASGPGQLNAIELFVDKSTAKCVKINQILI
ncbi:MAG: TIGR00282 family metallophosphoesterase [Endomicrobiia bacterium]